MTSYSILAESLFLEADPSPKADDSQNKRDREDLARVQQQAKSMGLVHKGRNFWGKPNDNTATHKRDGSKLVPIPKQEKPAQREPTASKPTTPQQKQQPVQTTVRQPKPVQNPAWQKKKKSVLHKVSTTGKPGFSTDFAHTAQDDTLVNAIFSSNAGLMNLPAHYKSVYGPTDNMGRLLRSGGKNSKEFYKHSVKHNTGIDNLKILFSKIAANNNGKLPESKKIAKVLVNYSKQLHEVGRRWDDFTPAQRGKIVETIYAQLSQNLHEVDAELVSPIMKNFAEMALYDSEIAREEEVYLPASQTFPCGDKIRVRRNKTNIEKIQLVSVKFGENKHKVYGWPSGAKALCNYHPDMYYRQMMGFRVGAPNYELGVTDQLIVRPEKFNDAIGVSGFRPCFPEETSKQIRDIGLEIKDFIKQYRETHVTFNPNKGMSPLELEAIKFEPKLVKLEKKLFNLIESTGNQEKLKELLGPNNYKQVMNPKGILSIYAWIGFGAALKTSDGFSSILHNFQEHNKGKYSSTTKSGTANLRDWQMQWYPYGKVAGGLRVGFNPSANEEK
jgi:hypothetical protein